jgi:hypothetical protein
MMTSGMVLRDEHVALRTFMINTRAMPTQQTAITGVSRRITAGQEIKAGLCRDPVPAVVGCFRGITLSEQS